MFDLNVLVIGATGQQGGQVARNLLRKGHTVRALVRDPGSAKSAELKALGIELVPGDFSTFQSLKTAMAGVDSVFAIGTPFAGIEAEVASGKALVDAASEAGVNHFVYSSVAGADRDTGIPHFDSKHQVENHVRSSDLNWTIVAPVFFMDNVLFPWNLADFERGVFRQALKPDTTLQLISVENIGQFSAAVIDVGERFFGQRIEIAGDELNGVQMAAALAASTNLELEFESQSLAEVGAQFADMGLMYQWFESTGFEVDISRLRSEFPEITWTDFATWADRVEWPEFIKI